MQTSLFQNAQRIISQILQWLSNSTDVSIADRVSDNFQNGVCQGLYNNLAIVGKDGDPTLVDFFHVEVQNGVAYIGGQRVIIFGPLATYNSSNPAQTTDDGTGNLVSTPQSTGSFNIPLTAGSINYLFIGYLNTIDTSAFTLNDVTLAKQFYKQTDGYQIVVNTTGTNPNTDNYILLGQINLTGSNQAVSSNISIVNQPNFKTLLNRVGIQTNNSGKTDRPSIYAIGSNNYFLDDHIKSVGTGTVSPFNAHGLSLTDLGINPNDNVEFHRIHEHQNGIIAGTPGNPDPTGSAMFAQRVQVTPGDDFIIVKALITGEVAVLNGIAYTSAQFGVDVTVPFTGNPAGVYNVYFDGTTIGITTSDISADETKLWLATTTWTPTVGDGNLSLPNDRRQFGTLDILQRWVTAGRPQNPLLGNFGYNFDSNQMEYYNGTTWVQPITNVISTENILINGGFDVWQRGTSFVNLASGTYTADRWKMGIGGGVPTYSVTQSSSVVDSGSYSLKYQLTSVGSCTSIYLTQLIENPQNYLGKTISISARVNSNVAGAAVVIFSNVTDVTSNTHTGDGTWQTLTATYTVPPSASSLQIIITANAGGNAPVVSTVYFDSVMLVIGNSPISYIPLNFANELLQCQRYYEKSYDIATPPGDTSGTNLYYTNASQVAATTSIANVVFKVTKRVVPTVTIWAQSGGTGNWNWTTSSGSVVGVATSVVNFGTTSFTAHETSAVYTWVQGHWTADAEM